MNKEEFEAIKERAKKHLPKGAEVFSYYFEHGKDRQFRYGDMYLLYKYNGQEYRARLPKHEGAKRGAK